jgi:hypothetical protein
MGTYLRGTIKDRLWYTQLCLHFSYTQLCLYSRFSLVGSRGGDDGDSPLQGTPAMEAGGHDAPGARPGAQETLCAGRGAGRTNASDVVGCTRARSSPSSTKIAWAKPNQVVSPGEVFGTSRTAHWPRPDE